MSQINPQLEAALVAAMPPVVPGYRRKTLVQQDLTGVIHISLLDEVATDAPPAQQQVQWPRDQDIAASRVQVITVGAERYRILPQGSKRFLGVSYGWRASVEKVQPDEE